MLGYDGWIWASPELEAARLVTDQTRTQQVVRRIVVNLAEQHEPGAIQIEQVGEGGAQSCRFGQSQAIDRIACARDPNDAVQRMGRGASPATEDGFAAPRFRHCSTLQAAEQERQQNGAKIEIAHRSKPGWTTEGMNSGDMRADALAMLHADGDVDKSGSCPEAGHEMVAQRDPHLIGYRC